MANSDGFCVASARIQTETCYEIEVEQKLLHSRPLYGYCFKRFCCEINVLADRDRTATAKLIRFIFSVLEGENGGKQGAATVVRKTRQLALTEPTHYGHPWQTGLRAAKYPKLKFPGLVPLGPPSSSIKYPWPESIR